MSEQDKLDLPGSGYDTIAKILHAYALCGDKPVTLGDVAAKATIDKTNVSRNNGFLLSLGLIEGAKKKKLSSLGKKLAIAIGHEIDEDIAEYWAKAIRGNKLAFGVVQMLTVQKSVPKEQFPAKVASNLRLVSGRGSATAVNTIIDVLLTSNLIVLEDNSYHTSAKVRPSSPKDTVEKDVKQPPKVEKSEHPKLPPPSAPNIEEVETIAPTVHIDIQVHISPDASTEQIDQIFASMAKHLYKRKAK